MRVIAVVNQKGGVGKTTTAVNLAAALAATGKSILLVDLDSQGHATMACGIDKRGVAISVYDVLTQTADLARARIWSQTGKFDLLPSPGALLIREAERFQLDSHISRLGAVLHCGGQGYEFVIIDCPPALATIMQVLAAAEGVVIPLQCEYYALEGLSDLVGAIKRVHAGSNRQLKILGLLRVMFDPQSVLARQVSDQAVEHFGDKVFGANIPRDECLATAPSYGIPGVLFDAESPGARAYVAFAAEVIARVLSLAEGKVRPPDLGARARTGAP